MTDLYENHQGDLSNYPCPCCGYFTFTKPPESHDICSLCFWHDDSYQLRHPHETGANKVTLIEAQKNYALIGAKEKRILPHVRPVNKSDIRDSTWLPIDLSIDNFEKHFDLDVALENLTLEEYRTLWEAKNGPTIKNPSDMTRLYYWRDNFWRQQESGP